jgi:spermidine/putrescine transport system substrate-binding protein
MWPSSLRCLLILSLLAMAPVCAGDDADAARTELVFLTWSEYVDPDLVAEFEREYGARVREVYFETDPVRDRIMVRTGGTGFDVLLLDNTSLGSYRRRGWIRPLDAAAMPNLAHIDTRWDTAYPDSHGWAVPYFWGTLGIAYRRDLTEAPLTSWMDLLDPDSALAGRILMADDSFDLVGVALKAAGHSMNSTDPDQIAEAEALLRAQRPAVRHYGSMSLADGTDLVSGDLIAAMTYNGDAGVAMGHNDAIVYVVPEEGSALWVDYLAIAGDAREPALAAAFIDFLNRPEVAARNARYLSYATPNRAAEELLPAAFRADPLVYPDADTLARCETYDRLPPAALRERIRVYSAIVHGH